MSSRESSNQMDSPRKYRERIHRESKAADNKNLPFTFSKPTKERPRNTHVICEKCKRDLYVSEVTILVTCGHCKHMTRVKDIKKKEEE